MTNYKSNKGKKTEDEIKVSNSEKHEEPKAYHEEQQHIYTPSSIIWEKVRDIIIEKLGVEESEVTCEARFEDLGADSLDAVELVMEFEKEFAISIPDDQAERMTTIIDVVNYIEAHSKYS